MSPSRVPSAAKELRVSLSAGMQLSCAAPSGETWCLLVGGGGALHGAGAGVGLLLVCRLVSQAQAPHPSWRAWGWGRDRQGCGIRVLGMRQGISPYFLCGVFFCGGWAQWGAWGYSLMVGSKERRGHGCSLGRA